MKQTRGQATIARLVDEGWHISHDALYNQYLYAGSVSKMQTRKGNEYCRVHHGHCKNVKCGGYLISMQITTVMYREVGA